MRKKMKSERRLHDTAVTIKRDMKWSVPFIKAACEKHNRAASDLFRHAFCVHFAGNRDADFVANLGPVEKQNWNRIPIRIPKDMSWMSAAVEVESQRSGRTPPMVFFIAFCEVYGKEFPELRAMYEKWQEVNVAEVA